MSANPISGPYTAPAKTYHYGPAKYQRVLTVTNSMLPFTATGSYAGPIAVSTNDNTAAVTLVLGASGNSSYGGTTTLADLNNNVIYDLGVYRITGTLGAGDQVHLYFAD